MDQEIFVRRLRAYDARVKIGLSLVIGVCAWQAGPWALGLFALGAGILACIVAGKGIVSRGQLRGIILFVGVWAGMKAGLELFGGNPQWWEHSLLLAARLLVLVLVGLCLAASTSRVQVGLAVSSLMRPFFKDKSWQGALSLALMIHFIPVAMGTMHTVKRSVSMRGQDLPIWRRLHLFVTTVMRNLSQSTWDQTMALAVRGLEEERAWRESQPLKAEEWIIGGLLGVSIWMLSTFGY
ncbi:MAG: CbiQ family ECF transporter T component [Desulfovermiculus sp.]|nr:CbiQ family ECF transporter T component [Desulfovermiculus sp.]